MTQAIPAIVALRPPSGWLPSSVPPPPVGSSLQLQVGSGPAGELLAQGPQGLELPLPAGSAKPGDLLLMRVITTEPRLQLQLLEHRPAGSQAQAAAPAADADSTPALRSDQAWLQCLHLGSLPASGNAPAAVAAQWRSRVLAELLRGAPGLPQPALPAPVAGEPALLPAPPLYPLLGWLQAPVLLRLLATDVPVWQLPAEDEGMAGTAGDAPQDSGSGLRLQLSLTLDGEPLDLLLQWQHGLLLYVAADSAALLDRLRLLLPRIGTRLAAIPLPLRYCRFGRHVPGGQGAASLAKQGLAHSSAATLFRAAAEIVALIQAEPGVVTGT